MTTSIGTPVSITRVISLAEMKLHARLDDTDTTEDSILELYIDAATLKFENDTRRSLIVKAYTYTCDDFPRESFNNVYGQIELPYSPLIDITSVYYKDSAGVSTLLASTEYSANKNNEPGAIYPVNNWPATYDCPDAVTITYTAGYASTPTIAKQAIILLACHWYENREATTGFKTNETPLGYDALVTNFKRWEA